MIVELVLDIVVGNILEAAVTNTEASSVTSMLEIQL